MPGGSLSKRLAEGTLLQILGRLASAAATFGSLALAARALGTAGFGILTFYLALWAILDVFVDGGSMTASLRRAAREPHHERAARNHALALRLVTVPIACLVAAGFAASETPSRSATALAGASVVFFAHWLAPKTLPLYRELRFRPLVASRVFGALVTLTCVIELERSGCRWPGAFLLAFGTGTLCQALLASLLSPPWKPNQSRIDFRPWLREALSLGAAAFARTGYFWLDALLVREICGAAEAGRYNAAYRLFNLALLFAIYGSSTALPLLSRDTAQNRLAARRLARALAVGGVLLAALVAWAAPWILVLAFGPEYEAAAPALRALCFGIAAVHVSALALTRLTAQARASAVALLSFVALAANAALDLWWIPLHGGVGAAWATAATEGLVALLALGALARFPAKRSEAA